jgi:hypothetical protein
MVGSRTAPERAYGIEVKADHETVWKADLFRQLRISDREHPLECLPRASGAELQGSLRRSDSPLRKIPWADRA